jgi:uncharacterized membrane protein
VLVQQTVKYQKQNYKGINMDSNIRTLVKVFSYRTVVAISIFLAALAMNYSAGFGLNFVIISYTIGFASFWIQERIWNRINWGRQANYDLKRRSIIKTITWRIWSFFVLLVVGMILGLTAQHAIEWSIVTNIMFIVVHYIHERVWNMINWRKEQIS